MGTVFRLLPFFAFLGYGVYTVLEVFFPTLRNADFNRWEVDEGSGSYIEIMGWRNVLKPPRVIAQGYMSDRTACAAALLFGILFIVIGFLGIRHIARIPEFVPDLFGGSR